MSLYNVAAAAERITITLQRHGVAIEARKASASSSQYLRAGGLYIRLAAHVRHADAAATRGGVHMDLGPHVSGARFHPARAAAQILTRLGIAPDEKLSAILAGLDARERESVETLAAARAALAEAGSTSERDLFMTWAGERYTATCPLGKNARLNARRKLRLEFAAACQAEAGDR